MRTTLDLDDDVLDAAKDLARRQRVSAGQLISRPLPSRGTLVSNDLVNRLRDQEGV